MPTKIDLIGMRFHRWTVLRPDNRRDNRRFSVGGQMLTSAEIGRRFNIAPNLLRQRIDRDGRSIEEAIKPAKWNGKDFDFLPVEVDPW